MINCENIIDLDALDVTTDNIEQLGTKEKFWFQHPVYNVKCLFKFSRGTTGEHWSEVVADKICDELMVPHANYELAFMTHDDGTNKVKKLGVFAKNVLPENFEMVIGNQFLFTYVTNALKENYPDPLQPTDRSFQKVKEHTVNFVLESLKYVKVLPEHQLNKNFSLSACDMYCGYLLLDVLISNQDRHHENWAVLQGKRDSKDELFICPSYDHASSLGANINDEEKKERLESKDKNRKIPAFTAKARSALYQNTNDRRPMTTIGAYIEATSHDCSSNNIREHWNEVLRSSLTPAVIENIINSIDDEIISPISKEFAIAMIKENRCRILSV